MIPTIGTTFPLKTEVENCCIVMPVLLTICQNSYKVCC